MTFTPKVTGKKNIWLKKEIGEDGDEKCHLICFLKFHGLLGNSSAVVCIHKLLEGGLERWGPEPVSFRTHKS